MKPETPAQNLEVALHDGSVLTVTIHGSGSTLLLPINPEPAAADKVEELKMYGVDPALGQSFIKGLSDRFQIVAFDYEGHVMSYPKPDTLTPDNVAKDMLSIADAVQADTFIYYGYSWLALVGLQLAIRTDRLSALIMGGFPPLNGPYKEMLAVTFATYDVAQSPQADHVDPDDEWSGMTLSPDQTKQFMTLYTSLQSFDDTAIQQKITCPKLCFVGSADTIQYAKKWGDVEVSMAKRLMSNQAELERLGWDVKILDQLDHIQAMQASNVLPIILPWLRKVSDS